MKVELTFNAVEKGGQSITAVIDIDYTPELSGALDMAAEGEADPWQARCAREERLGEILFEDMEVDIDWRDDERTDTDKVDAVDAVDAVDNVPTKRPAHPHFWEILRTIMTENDIPITPAYCWAVLEAEANNVAPIPNLYEACSWFGQHGLTIMTVCGRG